MGGLSLETELMLKMMLVGAVTNTACALVGCYLVLRRMSLLGDAISHAVLPGIAVAFLFSGQLGGPSIVIGATAVGVLTAWLSQSVHQWGKVPEDAGLGVVFTTLFALGVVLLSTPAIRNVDLDPGCVFYGLLELIPLSMGPSWWPPAGITLALGLVIGMTTLLWKEFKLVSFDPGLATALGLNATLLHYVLMGLVAAVTVASFQAVGSVLVVAMLIVPAATAQYWSDSLIGMMIWSVVVALVSAVAGCWIAVETGTNAAGMMAVVAGVLFAGTVLLAPKYGLVPRWIRILRLRIQVAGEDLLTSLYRYDEGTPDAVFTARDAFGHAQAATDMLSAWIAFRGLIHRGLIRWQNGHLRLTRAGQDRARKVLRAHRLWEAYLQQNFDLPLDHLHDPAHKIEHFLGPDLVAQLEEGLSRPDHDPHGRRIPEQSNGD